MSLTPSQIEARRKTIGGTDIGAILGENSYKTAYEVWEEKIENKSADFSKNKSVVIGKLLEVPLINKYDREENVVVKISTDTFLHRKYQFLSANVDGISIPEGSKDPHILEIKTASCFNKDSWGLSGSQIIPHHYYAQIAHYMLVTGYSRADVYVGFVDDSIVSDILCEIVKSDKLIEDIDFSEIVEKMETRLYTFYRDEEMEALILEAAISFYENHMRPWIEHGIKNPPPMDFSNKGFQNCLRKKYSIQEDSVIKLPPEFVKIKDKYLDFVLQSKELDKRIQEEKSKILAAMENNQKAMLDDGSYFLRKTIKRKESIVKASEYTKFEFKQRKGDV